MKKSVCKLMVTLMFGLLSGAAWSSNIQVIEKPELADAGAGFKLVKFGLSWDYSWRTIDPNNWDAAWIFVKYRVGSKAWDHMYLDQTYTPLVGEKNGVEPAYTYGFTDDKTKVVGVFLYRADNGWGTIKWKEVSLRWKYDVPNAYLGTETLDQNDEVTVKVFAIEMVYVPTGAFYLGSGALSTTSGEFCRADVVTANLTANSALGPSEPYLVESEDPINVRARFTTQAALDAAILAGTAKGLSTISNIFTGNPSTAAPATNSIGIVGDSAIPRAFPKGYQAVYCMKYEITQGAYVNFLNTLDVIQQTARTRVSPGSVAGTRAMQQTDATDRNYIKVLKSGVAEYACDMNNNGIYNEDADGQGVACAMNSRDLMAYLDFAGLRPMTELEYEKICRGPYDPVPNEFAWGCTYFLNGSGFLAGTGGTPDERPATAGANIMTNATAATGKLYVARNGVFANDSSGRVVSGATYWGVMEMSGNLWEYIIGVMNATGRAYTGNHGDGRLALSGDHDVANWPDLTNPHFGFGLRGGSVVEAAAVGSVHAVSNRANAWWNSNPGNSYNVGGRGVRTIK